MIVVAVSTSHMDRAGAAGGGSGSVAVEVAGAVAVHNINTTAEIESALRSTRPTTPAPTATSRCLWMRVAPISTDLTLGLGAAFSGSVAVSPGIAVPVLTGSTEALILRRFLERH